MTPFTAITHDTNITGELQYSVRHLQASDENHAAQMARVEGEADDQLDEAFTIFIFSGHIDPLFATD